MKTFRVWVMPALLGIAVLVGLAACAGGDVAPSGGEGGDAPPSTGAEGAEPDFEIGGDKFVSAADLWRNVEGGADIVFVDARPTLDFEYGHIPGAVNVPYFDTESYLDTLPQDRWIVTYCECPHAEAEEVADHLLDNGFTKVKVLDEGLQGWRDHGGETVGGAPAESS